MLAVLYRYCCIAKSWSAMTALPLWGPPFWPVVLMSRRKRVQAPLSATGSTAGPMLPAPAMSTGSNVLVPAPADQVEPEHEPEAATPPTEVSMALGA